MPSKPDDGTDAAWQKNSGLGLHGRRVLSWREWNGYEAGLYERGAGEGVRQSDRHLLVFSPMPRSPMLLQVDDDPARTLHQIPDAIGIYPAGTRIRTVGANSHFIQVCWSPDLYYTFAPQLPGIPIIGFDFFPDALLRQLARSLVDEIGKGSIDRLLADSLMTALIMRMAQRNGIQTLERLPDLPHARMRRVLDYIEAHLEQDLTLVELAGVACLSPSHFSRAFKQALGTGPHRYTMRRRVERAKDLLRKTRDSLAQMATATGFTDQSHFTAIFRRELGITPGRFRAGVEQQLRNNGP